VILHVRPFQEIILLSGVFRRETASGFYPWVKVDSPRKRVADGIVWLAAWKLVSNDAKRTVAPPNAKHSTLPQGCFLCFCFSPFRNFPQNRTNLLGWGNKKKEIGGDFLFL